VKDIYRAFLCLRPVCITLLIIYNFCIEYKHLKDWHSKQDENFELQQIRKERLKAKKNNQGGTQYEGGLANNSSKKMSSEDHSSSENYASNTALIQPQSLETISS